MFQLVITEKPSVAQSISRVIGANQRQDGYYEGNGYLVSWCVGHLVELAQPVAYGNYEKWRKEDLPILPGNWQYRVTAATQKQFTIVRNLLRRTDVDRLVCATDAGREGELIFRLVYHQCNCNKPFDRLWISSLEDSAIREGFNNLRPSSEYDALYEAALCRERADWIVGINASRLFSCLYRQPLIIGRVMTPTLGMTVQREAAISAFVPEPFYTIQLECGGAMLISDRIKDKAIAKALLESCKKEQQIMVTSIEKKKKAENPPALYDLTSLQREANRILGFTAQQTLDYTQSLYEKKLVTYPRTDSKYVTESTAPTLPGLAASVVKLFQVTGKVEVNARQVVNNAKVTDHHAILPTTGISNCTVESLPRGEQQILKLISIRLLVALGNPYLYEETSVSAECAGQIFSCKAKAVIDEGWKMIEKQFFPPKDEEEKVVTHFQNETSIPITSVEIKEGKTTAPKHFTEDLLLQAMEAASADEFPKEAERKGIGTPATRASIIEKLIQKGYLERKGNGKAKNLIPTPKGTALITVTPEQIQSPSMTAEWENKLGEIENSSFSATQFMSEISGMITDLVNTYDVLKGAETLMTTNEVVGNCPHCGSEVVEREKGWMCRNRECRFVLWKDNAYFKRIGKNLTKQMVAKLLREKQIRLKDCKSQRTGKNFNAIVLLDVEKDGRPFFTMDFLNGGGKN